MRRAERRLLDRDAACVQLLGLVVLGIREIGHGEIVQTLRGFGMVWPERLLAQLQRPPVEVDSLIEMPLGTVQFAEVGERGRQRRMRRAELVLLDRERALE